MMYYYNNFVPYHMFGLGSLFMILFWGCIFYVFFRMLRIGSCHSEYSPHSSKGNALAIIKERYAKGEITKEDFISMKKDIE